MKQHACNHWKAAGREWRQQPPYSLVGEVMQHAELLAHAPHFMGLGPVHLACREGELVMISNDDGHGHATVCLRD